MPLFQKCNQMLHISHRYPDHRIKALYWQIREAQRDSDTVDPRVYYTFWRDTGQVSGELW